MNLRSKMFLAIIPVIAVSIITLTFFSSRIASDSIEDQQIINMKNIVDKTMYELEQWLDEHERDALLLSRSPVVQSAADGRMTEKADKHLADYHKFSPDYEAVFIMDPGGKVLVNSIGQKIGLDVSSIPVYRENIIQSANGNIWFSSIGISPATGRPVCLMTAPVYLNGNVSGIIGMSIELKAFGDTFLKKIKIGKSGYMGFVDDTGQILYHPDKTMIMQKSFTDFEFGKKIMSLKNGNLVYEYKGFKKAAYFGTFSKNGWLLIAVADHDEFLSPVKRIRNILLIAGLFSVLLVIIITWVLSGSITASLKYASDILDRISKGDISMDVRVKTRDEAGQMLSSMKIMISGLKQKIEAFEAVAAGDLTAKISILSEKDSFGTAFEKMRLNLGNMIGRVHDVSVQVASGSEQISDATRLLAEGASQQAASFEEMTSSMIEIGSQVKSNAEYSSQASRLASMAKEAAENGIQEMSSMVNAMNEISDSSRSIAKIIKNIDEIAFQTNLLSLNAAVEAARAGRHGKGFAVVAGEVRNLAGRSAKAAKETAGLIESTVKRIENGNLIASRTAEALEKISGFNIESADLVSEIAAASDEQANELEQINQGLAQTEQVTQQNTASSEEIANSAALFSSQAAEIQDLLKQFRLRKTGSFLENDNDENISRLELKI